MKLVKGVAIVGLCYLALVIGFESLIGYFQPSGDGTLVIYTEDDSGASSERVVARLETDGQLYVAANHWPRAWYRRALENPSVRARVGGTEGEYLAVPVTGVELERVNAEHRLGPVFRFLTGFPPRHILRLDPR